MKLPAPRTAPEAIRSIAAIVKNGVLRVRTPAVRTRREVVLARIRSEYAKAPRDEHAHTIHRPRAPDEPFRTYYGKTPDELASPFTYGYDRVACRKRRVTKRVFPHPSSVDLPATWHAFFFDRIAWPPENYWPGQQPFQLFVRIERGHEVWEVPIHDPRERWVGSEGRLRSPFPFPIDSRLPYLSYLVVGERMASQTLHRWLTIYLAQRSFLTRAEEDHCIAAYFCSGSAEVRTALLSAYRLVKRGFSQPINGRPSFSEYLRRTVLSQLRDIRAVEWRSDPNDDMGNVVLKTLRRTEPKLYCAVRHRIRSKGLKVVRVDGEDCVSREAVLAIDRERQTNAEARRAKRFSQSTRRAWIVSMMQLHGLSKSSARRKLARWINDKQLSLHEIDRSVALGRLARR